MANVKMSVKMSTKSEYRTKMSFSSQHLEKSGITEQTLKDQHKIVFDQVEVLINKGE